jgi:hypothetical protein
MPFSYLKEARAIILLISNYYCLRSSYEDHFALSSLAALRSCLPALFLVSTVLDLQEIFLGG